MRMKGILAVPALLALLAACAAAQPAPAPPPPPGPEPEQTVGEEAAKPDRMAELSRELQDVLKAMDEAGKKIESLEADVQYEREIELLDEFQKAKGQMKFLRPDMLHLKLGKPRNEEALTDGKHWWITSHDDKQVEIYLAAATGEGAAELAFLTFGIGESAGKLLEAYDVTIAEKKEDESAAKDKDGNAPMRYRLRFVPRNEESPKHFAAIEVEVVEGVWLPARLALHESDGEIVQRFHFTKVKLNAKLSPEDFAYKKRKGYVEVWPATGL